MPPPPVRLFSATRYLLLGEKPARYKHGARIEAIQTWKWRRRKIKRAYPRPQQRSAGSYSREQQALRIMPAAQPTAGISEEDTRGERYAAEKAAHMPATTAICSVLRENTQRPCFTRPRNIRKTPVCLLRSSASALSATASTFSRTRCSPPAARQHCRQADSRSNSRLPRYVVVSP